MLPVPCEISLTYEKPCRESKEMNENEHIVFKGYHCICFRDVI